MFQDAVVDQALHRPAQPRDPRVAVGRADRRGGGAHRRARATEFGLAEILDRPVSTYSGGQRRRLEIARALSSRSREVLFLDEPTVGLDPRIRFELLDLIAGLRVRDGHHRAAHDALPRRSRAPVRPRSASCTPAGSSRSTRPRSLLAELGDEVLELRVDGRARRRRSPTLQRRDGSRATDAFVGGLDGDRAGARPAATRRARARSAALDLTVDRDQHARRRTLDDVYLRLTGDRLAPPDPHPKGAP